MKLSRNLLLLTLIFPWVCSAQMFEDRYHVNHWQLAKLMSQCNHYNQRCFDNEEHLDFSSALILTPDYRKLRRPEDGAVTFGGIHLYLADLGVNIMRFGDDGDLQRYLNSVSGLANEFYIHSVRKLSGGRMALYSQGVLQDLHPGKESDGRVLPMNMNAAYAYFCAVVNEVNMRLTGNIKMPEQRIAYRVTRWLEDRLVKVTLPNGAKTYVWQYRDGRKAGQYDDYGHGGVVAKSISYLSKNSYLPPTVFYYTETLKNFNLEYTPKRIDGKDGLTDRLTSSHHWYF